MAYINLIESESDSESLSEISDIEFEDLCEMVNIIKNSKNTGKIITQDVINNLNIFSTWMNNFFNKIKNETDLSKIRYENCRELELLYKNFVEQFSQSYRMDLYKNILNNFNNEPYVNDEIIYYWKVVIASIFVMTKKYKDYYLNLNDINISLKVDNHFFVCNVEYLDDDVPCSELEFYFKENDVEYYLG